MLHNRPRVGITVGDPAGIGPEVMARSVAANKEAADYVIYGPKQALSGFVDTCENRVIDLDGTAPIGAYTRAGGQASIRALQQATTDLAAGRIDALVTGPIDKRAFLDAGLDFPGQTEMVARALGVHAFAMNLSGPVLRISLVTTHVAVRAVAEAITRQKVITTIELTRDFLKSLLGKDHPAIGVLGLNPHASDHGRFGDEEERVIAPAIAHARQLGVNASGPLPADTAFTRAVQGEFDGLVAMYHDQGLGPLKLMHFNNAVNITLGLPRPRTSPDHGPAFDIAGLDKADPSSAIEAVRMAIKLAHV